ncbi:MoxR-like ATPase [Seinonella peptonophila]|uniref:MoxR-like ATPase n=1 Tax=Seinonella peptonophila TaxID=112248 RepID=A0A1M4WMH2_9BACL|nr:AAA family ATPase [Seinonella peptonophila]SHE82404.1 MoxR-like ATPase [Seinonella peptonophila]
MEKEWKERWEAEQQIIAQLRKVIQHVIIGQEQVIEQVLIAILARGHILLEGLPGLGKTLLVRTLAQALDLSFSRIQFTPDLMPADIIGTQIITNDEQGMNFRFQTGPVFAHLLLADEINRATPKTQSALLEAMQEQTVTVGKESHQLPEPFFVLATQNPLESEGTYPLPEAQTDRFLLKTLVGLPSSEELKQIVIQTAGQKQPMIEVVADGAKLVNIQQTVSQILISDEIIHAAIELVMKTHPQHQSATEQVKQFVRYGSGPRGAQALVQAARARAFLYQRYHVSFEDLEQVAYPVLRHRLLLNFEADAVGVNSDQLISSCLAGLKEGVEK